MKYMNTIAIALLSFLTLTGCSLIGSKNLEVPAQTYTKQPYVIGISDQLKVDVWRNVDLTRNVSVRPDGFITMPLMGDVKAEGRTPEVLAGIISDALKAVIKNPEVAVSVTNPVSVAYQYRVRVMGQVNQPISVTFVEGMTVMDLVLAAGGVGPFGAPNRATLNRMTDAGYQEYRVRLDDILENGDISTNYNLQPADILTIPEKRIWRGEF